MGLVHAAFAVMLAFSPSYTRPTPAPLPADVWVNPAADLGVTAWYAAGFVNRYTDTKFTCAAVGDDCQPAPCPSSRMCLTIRWGTFDDDSKDARFEPILCSGVCTKAGLILLNPEGPLFGRYGYSTPFHVRLLLEQQIGVFAGLAVRTDCASSMSHWSCKTEGFTPAEQQHLAGW